MSNKVTAKDVAREAGVSVATVSYVMNGRTDQKISPETKKKILQIANLMNYIPSHAAKTLATGVNNTIGISYCLSGSPTYDAKISAFANMMIERLNRMKYDVTFIPSRTIEGGLPINRNVDAIIAIDLTHADFRCLADNYLVPVICVDMLVNDTLFYQIYEDIPFLIEKARIELNTDETISLVYDEYSNSAYESFIIDSSDKIFPVKKRELTDNMISKIASGKTIILGGFLALSIIRELSPEDTLIICSESERALIPSGFHVLVNNDSKKANTTMNIVMNSIVRNFDITHDHRIR